MIKFNYSESIEQYLSRELSPAERDAFLAKLKSDPKLAAEFRLSREIDEALSHEDIIDLRGKILKQFKERMKQQEPVIIPMQARSREKWYWAAASVTVLLLVASAFWFSLQKTDPTDKLFNEYYTSENIIDVTRSGNGNVVEAVFRFQQKDYALSAKLFGEILTADKSNMAVWFYYGISNIETENYGKAIEAFKTILNNNDNLYVEHADWYLGLCYLKSNQEAKAKLQFEKIVANPDNYHRQDALHILSKMN